jgi:hypothetical protein
MAKDNARARLKRAKVDGDAVQGYWLNLSLQEKRQILRFEDPLLVERLFNTWQTLCISDMTCYIVGLGGQDELSKKVSNQFFAIEGFISQNVVLHQGAFYAKLALVEKPDFFEILEKWIGSPLLVGRPMLHRCDWPSLFKASVNSWSQLLIQIFKLMELAVYHAEQLSRIKKKADHLCSIKDTSPGKSSKRNARGRLLDRRRKALANICPVCDGSGSLLDDPCPLCADALEAETVEPTNTTTVMDSKVCLDVSEAETEQVTNTTAVEDEDLQEDVEFDDEQDEDESLAWMDLLAGWSSGWERVGRHCTAADGNMVLFERQTGSFEEDVGPYRAIVKNTFVQICQDIASAPVPAGFSRSQSLPSL